MRDITAGLDAIRPEIRPYRAWNTRALAAALLGVAMGFLAKALDNVAVIGEIGTNLGVWIFAAALIAAYSPARRAAALRVFLFFAGMLAAYYLHSRLTEGFFPRAARAYWARSRCSRTRDAAGCVARARAGLDRRHFGGPAGCPVARGRIPRSVHRFAAAVV